ncbi:DNA polymerase family A protein [Pannonibacter tanglangensis]|uniref:DNA polymerase n=1 Tax=Pannonibacter tanglangensis TaxID=2750084 RepID=A0ABW9ZEG6_9HYPH|nr:hypothetical protein [Pannonibacter sp. XCT-34]NBN62076.1 hypothetical protein [Pannonibacter sp. XCT-34]
MATVHIDFETRSTCELKTAGAHKYAEHPDTGVWCMAYAVDDDPVRIWKPGDPWPGLDMGATFMAHNATFELQIWNKIMVRRYGWPALLVEQMRCTMAMAYALGLPGSLEQAAAAVGLPVRKDMDGRNQMLRMAKPRQMTANGPIWWDDPARLERLYSYCMNDVVVERELERRLVPLSADEQALWVLDQIINERGVYADVTAAQAALGITAQTKKLLDAEMVRVTGGWVKACTSVAQLIEWMSLRGVETAGVAKADITDLLDRDDLPDDVRKALELRRDAAKSSTAKLKAILEAASDDNRVRGVLQYHGAGTGRWAGRRVQPQNMPRTDKDIAPLVDEILEGLAQ